MYMYVYILRNRAVYVSMFVNVHMTGCVGRVSIPPFPVVEGLASGVLTCIVHACRLGVLGCVGRVG